MEVSASANTKPCVVKAVLHALSVIVIKEVKEKGNVVIPRFARFVLKYKPSREAYTKKMFGKQVAIPAKAAVKLLKVIPARQLKDVWM